MNIEELGDIFHEKFNHLPLSNNNDEWGNAFGIFRAGYDLGKPKWISVEEATPTLSDRSVLVQFENGSIETVHVQYYFEPVRAGLDAEGNQLWRAWYLVSDPKVTHWQELPEPAKT